MTPTVEGSPSAPAAFDRKTGIADVIGRALAPFAIEERVVVNGPALFLEGRIATALGMAVHELATNACKYGALSTAGGRIAITWAAPPDDEAPQLTLHWEESGGPAVQLPSRRGFGSKMIERVLAAEFNGKVPWTSDHLAWYARSLCLFPLIPSPLSWLKIRFD